MDYDYTKIEEAEIITKPPIHYSLFRVIVYLFIKGIKLIPITIAIMVLVWGLSFVFLQLLGIHAIS